MASPTAMSSAVNDSKSAAILALSHRLDRMMRIMEEMLAGTGCAPLQATSVIRSSTSMTSSTTPVSSHVAPASDVTTAVSATAPTNSSTAKMTTTLAPPVAIAPVSSTSPTPITSMKTNITSSTPTEFGLGTPGAAAAYVRSTSISTTVHVTCSTKGPNHTTSVPVPICLTANKKIIKKLCSTKTLLKKHGKDLIGHWLEDMEADKAKVAAGTLLPYNTTAGIRQASSTSLPTTTPALMSTPTLAASSEQDYASDAPTTCLILGPCIDADTGRAAVTSQLEIDVLPLTFAAPSVEAEVPTNLSIMFLTQGSSHDIVPFLCPEVIPLNASKSCSIGCWQCRYINSSCHSRLVGVILFGVANAIEFLADHKVLELCLSMWPLFSCHWDIMQFQQPWPPPMQLLLMHSGTEIWTMPIRVSWKDMNYKPFMCYWLPSNATCGCKLISPSPRKSITSCYSDHRVFDRVGFGQPRPPPNLRQLQDHGYMSRHHGYSSVIDFFLTVAIAVESSGTIKWMPYLQVGCQGNAHIFSAVAWCQFSGADCNTDKLVSPEQAQVVSLLSDTTFFHVKKVFEIHSLLLKGGLKWISVQFYAAELLRKLIQRSIQFSATVLQSLQKFSKNHFDFRHPCDMNVISTYLVVHEDDLSLEISGKCSMSKQDKWSFDSHENTTMSYNTHDFWMYQYSAVHKVAYSQVRLTGNMEDGEVEPWPPPQGEEFVLSLLFAATNNWMTKKLYILLTRCQDMIIHISIWIAGTRAFLKIAMSFGSWHPGEYVHIFLLAICIEDLNPENWGKIIFCFKVQQFNRL